MEGKERLPALVEQLIADFQDRPIPQGTPRRLKLAELSGKADAIVGMRRSGKTWFLYQQLQDRLAAGVGRDRLLYVNFEDERLLPLAAEDLHFFVDAFYRRYPESRKRRHLAQG